MRIGILVAVLSYTQHSRACLPLPAASGCRESGLDGINLPSWPGLIRDQVKGIAATIRGYFASAPAGLTDSTWKHQ